MGAVSDDNKNISNVPVVPASSDGVQGISTVPATPGVTGINNSAGLGVGFCTGILGTSTFGVGVHGDSVNDNGILGTTAATGNVSGVNGTNSGSGPGVSGTAVSGDGMFGLTSAANSSGVHGMNSGTGPGVHGESSNGHGVWGSAADPNHAGVQGVNTGTGPGVLGNSSSGHGVSGTTGDPNHAGVLGLNTGTGPGVHGIGQNGGHAAVFDGQVQHNGVVTVSKSGDIQMENGDCAEEFDITDAEEIGPGTVMVLDQDGAVRTSHKAYDTKVAGVISGAGGYKPALILDRRKTSLARMPIALFGKVYCKVDAQYAAIEVGDLLTTSPTPGHAMKAEDPIKAFGTVLGKALSPIAEGEGLIPVLVTLQ